MAAASKKIRGSCVYTLFCIGTMILPLFVFFLTLWICQCVFETKHHFTPTVSSSSNSVNFCIIR